MAKEPAVRIETAGCCGPVFAGPLDDRDAVPLAHAFAALGDPVRLRLLGLLASAEAGEVCACDLVEPLGKSQPTVSHHLKVLSEAGLIIGDKRGRWIWYSIVPEQIDALRDALAVGPDRVPPSGARVSGN